jgi:protein-L-isoaspartate(D-aspartate) O-methyltransferase
VKKDETDWGALRQGMVQLLAEFYHIRDERVLRVMKQVPRHLYIPEDIPRVLCPYGDHPGPIGFNQTISQPFIVAYMTGKLNPQPGEKVLEIGTGSGYQSAILAALGAEIYTIEAVPQLAQHARRVLDEQGVEGVQIRCGDGYAGWPEQAPFDVILCACAPEEVPASLVGQLAEGGRMMLPVGKDVQRLVLLHRRRGVLTQEEDLPVRFVPMVHPPAPSARTDSLSG